MKITRWPTHVTTPRRSPARDPYTTSEDAATGGTPIWIPRGIPRTPRGSGSVRGRGSNRDVQPPRRPPPPERALGHPGLRPCGDDPQPTPGWVELEGLDNPLHRRGHAPGAGTTDDL